MSRIDEALRLTGVPSKAGESHERFSPAWTVEDGGRPRQPEPAPAQLIEPEFEATADRTGLVRFASEWRDRLATGAQADPTLLEQFRRLAATLHHLQQADGTKSVMVTSGSPEEGKTLTAINLAVVLAESYRSRVLLIDSDLRRPSIPKVVELGLGIGLGEALRAREEQKLALVRITPRLTILPAGQPVTNSIDALTSPRMRMILEEARARFDWVILDAPPVGLTTDANILSQMVDGALMVIRAGKTQYADAVKAIDTIGRDRIIGVVLNGVADRMDNYYGGYGGESVPRSDQA